MRRGLIIGAVLLLGLLAGCKGKEEAPESPEAYVLGADSAPALDKVMEHGEGELLSVDEPSQEGSGSYVYRYGAVSQPAALVGRYLEQLTGTEEGFVLADEEHRPLPDQPELSDESGTVTLERASSQEGRLFQITVTWEGESCTIQISEPEGALLPVKEEEEEDPFTLVDQLDYLYSFPPEQLGLEGKSMKEYRIYPVEGVAMVDGKACRQFNVYRLRAPEQTNTIEGSYFLSADRRDIYRLDTATGATISLN